MLVNYGGRVGYAASLQGALDEVFGPGAGSAVAQPGQPAQQPAPGAPVGGAEPRERGPGGGRGAIQQAITQLKAAQQSGDFAAQGQALAALDAAVQRYQQLSARRRLTRQHGPADGGRGLASGSCAPVRRSSLRRGRRTPPAGA